jgi:hypothetical protein
MAMRVHVQTMQGKNKPSADVSVWTDRLYEHTGYKSRDLYNCREAYHTLAKLILKS